LESNAYFKFFADAFWEEFPQIELIRYLLQTGWIKCLQYSVRTSIYCINYSKSRQSI